MRDIIDIVSKRPSRVMFTGTSAACDTDLTVPSTGLLFSDFDTAVSMGRFVWECEVETSEETKTVRIDDIRSVNVIDCYDTHCPDALSEEVEIPRFLREFRPDEGSHVVLVTGKLARTGLSRVMKALDPEEFTYEIRVLDKAVAAWFDTEFVGENIGDLEGVDIVLLPGKTAGDEQELEERLGVCVIRGTDCYSELPTFLEYAGVEVDSDDIVRPKIVMLGREGAGKTTYGGELASTYEIPHVTLGDIVRAGVEEEDETAIEAMQLMAKGEMVPHNVMAELVRARLLLPDMKNGFVLDGYPRIERDAEWLADMQIKPDAVVYLHCDEDTAQERIVGRKGRLSDWDTEMKPVVDHYRGHPGFIEIDTTTDDVLTDLYTKLEMMFQQCLRP